MTNDAMTMRYSLGKIVAEGRDSGYLHYWYLVEGPLGPGDYSLYVYFANDELHGVVHAIDSSWTVRKIERFVKALLAVQG